MATSDESGRFSVASVGSYEFLWASHPDFLSSRRVHVFVGLEEQPVELHLEEPAGHLSLCLRDARGAVLGDAPVELDWDRTDLVAVVTDPDGALQAPVRSVSGVRPKRSQCWSTASAL